MVIKVDIKCKINRHTHSRIKSNRDVAGKINSSSEKISIAIVLLRFSVRVI